MSHTVVRLNGALQDSLKAEDLKTTIKDELDARGYNTNDVAVNDGENMDGQPTLRANIDFVKPSEANSFTSYLEKLVKAHSDSFESATVDSHDCKHLEGLNEPCEIGYAWRL